MTRKKPNAKQRNTGAGYGFINFRMSPEYKQMVMGEAASQNMSQAKFITKAIDFYLAHRPTKEVL